MVLAGAASASPDDVVNTTNAGDNLRTGWYPEEGSLTPSLVKGNTFGRLWTANLEGSINGQPLLADGTLVVATEKNKVYGLDPKTGAQKWSKPLDLGTPWNPADVGCADIVPTIGVTSTPVFDPGTDTMYLTHKTYASGSSGVARWYMDAVDVKTGLERPSFPVELSGAAQNVPGVNFTPTTELQRPGLLLLNGVVYAAFGGHCDTRPWRGWIFGVSTQKAQVTARWAANSTEDGAGIWQSGAGITSDGPNTMLISTGNGGAPTTPTPGATPPANLGESIVRLRVQANGELKPVDFFAPFDAQQLDETDADFASGGVTGLPQEYFGTPAFPRLAVAVGKEGYVYLLDRDDLGGYRQGSGSGDDTVQRLGPFGGVWSRPGVWPGDGGYLYIPTATDAPGGGGTFDVYKYGLTVNGRPSLSRVATASENYGWGSGAPVITSDHTASGSAIVWLTRATDRSGANGQLRAYEAVPSEGKLVQIFSAPIGTSTNYSVPGVGAGRIYVGNREGQVFAFGSPVTPVLTGSPVNFSTTTTGQSTTRTATFTATETLNLTGLTSNSSQFTVGTPSSRLPAHLVAGQSISVPVTFAPTKSGLINATLKATTETGAEATLPLSGTGRLPAASLSVSPPVVSFGGTAVNGHLTGSLTIRNEGGEPLKITHVTAPDAPFDVTEAPPAGTTVAGGEALLVTLEFNPTQVGAFESSFAFETSAGNADIPLTGTAGTAGHLQFAEQTVDFGAVPVGATVTKSFTLENVGGTTVTITKSKPPLGGDFAATTSLEEGETIKPGQHLTESISFTPSVPGARSGSWMINGDDDSGLHELRFIGSGAVPPPPSALRVLDSTVAPAGSTQAGMKVLSGGTCPSAFTVGPLGDGEEQTTSPDGAVAGAPCTVEEAAPAGEGGSWAVVAVVNGGPSLVLAERDAHFIVPSFVLGAGVNTIELRNTWTPAPAVAAVAPPGAPKGGTGVSARSAAGGHHRRRKHRHRRHRHRHRHGKHHRHRRHDQRGSRGHRGGAVD